MQSLARRARRGGRGWVTNQRRFLKMRTSVRAPYYRRPSEPGLQSARHAFRRS